MPARRAPKSCAKRRAALPHILVLTGNTSQKINCNRKSRNLKHKVQIQGPVTKSGLPGCLIRSVSSRQYASFNNRPKWIEDRFSRQQIIPKMLTWAGIPFIHILSYGGDSSKPSKFLSRHSLSHLLQYPACLDSRAPWGGHGDSWWNGYWGPWLI